MITSTQANELLTNTLINRDVAGQRQAMLRPFPCNYCPRTFRTIQDASIHMINCN